MSPFIVPLALFGMILAIVKMGIEYSKWEKERTSVNADQTLGVSELEALIEEAVERATAPLEQRIERLEKRLPTGSDTRELRAHADET